MPDGMYCSMNMPLQACREHNYIFMMPVPYDTTHFGPPSVTAPVPLSVS